MRSYTELWSSSHSFMGVAAVSSRAMGQLSHILIGGPRKRGSQQGGNW